MKRILQCPHCGSKRQPPRGMVEWIGHCNVCGKFAQVKVREYGRDWVSILAGAVVIGAILLAAVLLSSCGKEVHANCSDCCLKPTDCLRAAPAATPTPNH
jgi:hypothetical protein